jgi:hypothetical protein
MTRLTRSIIEQRLPAVFTSNDVRHLEPHNQVRHCQMSRAIASGDVIRIRRGFYTLNKIFRTASINERIVANLLVPESYISLETALWDAGWIPEFVYEIASVSLKPFFEVKTPFAVFSYTRVPQKNLMAGTSTVAYGSGATVEAKPLKALADYVYVNNYDWNSIKPLRQSLRIDDDNLMSLAAKDFDELQGNYEADRAKRFLDGIRRELRV